jgi:hypothetical protein
VPSLTYSIERAGAPDLPADVLDALEPGPSILVRVADGTTPVALIVVAVTAREVEVFHLADAALGGRPRRVLAAARFVDAGGRAFHDRYRASPAEDAAPDGRVHFMETYLYREPDQIVVREQLEPGGAVHEQLMESVDISDKYLPWPASGDWEPFVRFSDT